MTLAAVLLSAGGILWVIGAAGVIRDRSGRTAMRVARAALLVAVIPVALLLWLR